MFIGMLGIFSSGIVLMVGHPDLNILVSFLVLRN